MRERFFKSGRDSRYFYRAGSEVNAQAFDLIDAAGEARFFLWLHYMEPHDPYFDREGSSWAKVSDPNPPVAAAGAMHRAYRDGVHRFDTSFGDLVAGLKARDLWNSTQVIVTADHGEEFADHGGFYHGTSLYEELLHIPLIIHSPVMQASVYRPLVRQIDIAPTVLDLFGVAAPATWEGASLLSNEETHTSVAEENHQGNVLSAIRSTDTRSGNAIKYINAQHNNPRGLPDEEFFDLGADPLEKTPFAAADPRVIDLRRRLATTCADSKRGAPKPQALDLDGAAKAQLRALGYVQ